MKLELDKHSNEPLVEQLVESLVGWIGRNGGGGGSRLPSIRRLAAEHGISRNVVIEAYERLMAQGLVRSRPGSGFYVAATAQTALAKVNAAPSQLEDFTNDMWSLFQADEDHLKLGCGWLPNHWREGDDLTYAIRQVARQSRSGIFDYSTPLGPLDLRGLIQERVRLLNITADASQILMTGGGSHSLDLLVRFLLEPGDVVFVESPGYYNLIGLLRLQRIHVIGVPRLENGPDIDRMEALLAQHNPKLFFINSVFHNPTGSTLAPAIAHRILQLAEAHDFQIVEDDIYADFQLEPSTRLAALDGLDRVIYLSSFSKSLTSSLRVGFIIAKQPLLKPLVDIKMLTSISSSRFAEQVVTTMLQNGSYRKLTERLRSKLSEQMASALTLLKRAGWEVFIEPAGGMFVWARHPAADSSAQLVDQARRMGITLSPGHLFLPEGDDSPWIRLNVAYMSDPRARSFISEPGGTLAYGTL
ncbi:PLP-dependent aminotransferase family protein [Billgrantia bachuensis]|uniref:PLP-dependent aminotransferase family protein n=1 Tax=Billgrantia bachuensis TaxID=2717286 RepID=A0ABX0PSG0_9GAMM|nr:PLP-dependent aminotransferase family protein [Halomonas bachuensis]NIC06165.1 PLP-dependent aminotransferase family protein [Halomonas bachuensis]